MPKALIIKETRLANSSLVNGENTLIKENLAKLIITPHIQKSATFKTAERSHSLHVQLISAPIVTSWNI